MRNDLPFFGSGGKQKSSPLKNHFRGELDKTHGSTLLAQPDRKQTGRANAARSPVTGANRRGILLFSPARLRKRCAGTHVLPCPLTARGGHSLSGWSLKCVRLFLRSLSLMVIQCYDTPPARVCQRQTRQIRVGFSPFSSENGRFSGLAHPFRFLENKKTGGRRPPVEDSV